MKGIPLGGKAGKGKVTIVDDDVYEWASAMAWHVSGGYAEHAVLNGNGKTPTMFKLHQIIIGRRKGMRLDHINGNTLDNRRENLRFVTPSQNKMNSQKWQQGATSVYKGVSKRFGKFWPRVQINGQRAHIGGFLNERHAAMAYDLWAIDLFGEFAKTNFNVVAHTKRRPAA